MKFTANYTLPAPRDRVFALLTDPAVLEKCIEGCEKMVRTSEDNYDAHLKIGIAGLKGNYVGKVQLKDQHLPESYTLHIEGKGGPGFVKGLARIHLTDHVLRPVRIGHTHGAFGIIAPIAIHNKTIVMFAGHQFDRRHPDTVFSLLHWDGSLLPIGEITGQRNSGRGRRGEAEGLFPRSLCQFSCH